MTAATLPDVDLEAWLAGEIEQRCDGTILDLRCRWPAEWMFSWRLACPCDAPRAAFVCPVHKWVVESREWGCPKCSTEVEFTWTKRIRSPR